MPAGTRPTVAAGTTYLWFLVFAGDGFTNQSAGLAVYPSGQVRLMAPGGNITLNLNGVYWATT